MLTIEDFKKYPHIEIKLCSYCELGYSLELVAILDLYDHNDEVGHNVYYQIIETQCDNKRTTSDFEDLKEAIDVYYNNLQRVFRLMTKNMCQKKVLAKLQLGMNVRL